MTYEQRLDDVNLAALGQDLLGSQDITGTGDVRLNLVTQGSNLGAMRRDLDGDVGFSVTNGSLEGIRFLVRASPCACADRQHDVAGARRRGAAHDVLVAVGDRRRRGRRAHEPRLNGTLDFMSLDGAGTVNLLTTRSISTSTAKLVDGPVLQSDPGMAKMAGDSCR